MNTLVTLVLVTLLLLLLTGIVMLWLWRRADEESRVLIRGIGKLSIGRKIRLARSLAGDQRIPLLVRLLPPALVLYLAMPLDLIPDFVPVLGQADDILVAAVGVFLLLRLTPRPILEEKLQALNP